ncbi:MAG TPA: methyltransferase domain-containing protein [Candidatus Eremiobacteraceae bacterium]|nr:methyltransferase domain-containing protein [Candidatus Eremiobacteraceae bacterium]
MSEYTLSQATDPETERQRLALLQQCFDPLSIPCLERTGIAAGWRCIDVGAGAGSISRWLAERVGPAGSVLAVDLDLRLLEPHISPTLSVRRLDIRREELPENVDLVHSRLLLEHLPEYEAVLHRMIRALRPGGWLVASDSDFRAVRLSAPDPAFDRVAASFAAATRAAGWDMQLGPSLAPLFETAGLRDVASESSQTYQRGGPRSVLLASSYLRLRDLLTQHGATSSDIEYVAGRMASPAVGTYGPTIWTAWGRKSGE